MKTKKLYANLLATLLFALLAISFTSCNKDDDEEPEPEPTKSEIISKAIWNFNKVEVYDENNQLVDTDDNLGYKIEFKTDYTYVFYEQDGSVGDTGQWDVNENGTKLYISEGSDTMAFDIIKLTDTEFTFSYGDNTSVNPSINSEIFYKISPLRNQKSTTYTKWVYYLTR